MGGRRARTGQRSALTLRNRKAADAQGDLPASVDIAQAMQCQVEF
jgi:hypothetical protein